MRGEQFRKQASVADIPVSSEEFKVQYFDIEAEREETRCCGYKNFNGESIVVIFKSFFVMVSRTY